MTIRLYYQDAYLQEFTGTVTDRREVEGRPAVVLDRTAFYPASGGQPFDTGTLETARVLGVEEDPSGEILHFLDGEVPAAATVTGRIDWQRRFDHMQQHTGQHILSQAFLQLARAQTIGFHLGAQTSTIDLDVPLTGGGAIEEAEALAGRVIFEDRPVHILTADRAQIETLGVRKEPVRDGPIRVIDVEGFDRSPCGGTHVRRTGEIGLAAILGHERYKGGTRVEFVAGYRACHVFRKEHQLLGNLGRLFTGHPYDLPQLAEKCLVERSSLAKENARLRDQLIEKEAEEMVARADKVEGIAVIRLLYSDRKFDSLKVLAQKVTSRPGAVALLATTLDSPMLVAARSKDVPGDCNAAVKENAAALGGKGGGRPELAQAGGMPAEAVPAWLERLEEHFRLRIRSGR